MKLTQAMREDFISDVMRDVPWRNTITDQKACDECVVRALALVPAEVQRMVRSHPGLMAFDSEKMIGFPSHEMSFDMTKGCGAYRPWTVYIPRIVSMSDVGVRDLITAVIARDTESLERHGMKKQIRDVVMSCYTTLQLAEALPELKRYIPEAEEPIKALPVVPIGLMSQLKRAGLLVQKVAA